MGKLDRLLEIEKIEEALRKGTPPHEVFKQWEPSRKGSIDYSYSYLGGTFQYYLNVAGVSYIDATGELLVNAFRAALRLWLVDDDEAWQLYLTAQAQCDLERTKTQEALQSAAIREEDTRRRYGEALDKERVKNEELKQEVASLNARLEALSGGPTE